MDKESILRQADVKRLLVNNWGPFSILEIVGLCFSTTDESEAG
jgi:hypothetical protein